MPRFVVVVLAVVLIAPMSAFAQARPAPSSGVPELRGAHVVRDARGVHRAWSLAIALPGTSPSARASAFLAAYGPQLAVAHVDQWRIAGEIPVGPATVVRFTREVDGARVLGASIVVTVSRRGIEYVGVAQGWQRDRSGRRQIEVADAVRGVGARVTHAAAAWVPMPDGRLVPVIEREVAGDSPLDRRRDLVDATDGALLLSHPLMHTARGRVYASNPIKSQGETEDVELLHLTSRERLTGRYFRVANCNAGARGCDPTQLAVADGDGNFLFEPAEPRFDEPFVEVHAYHHANRVAGYFRDTHEFEWTCGGNPAVMNVFVNYTSSAGAAYDNAAYSPTSGSECGYMLYGQGAERDFAYDADVIYHEYTHAIVDALIDLEYFVFDDLGVAYDPSALNEGTADYFSATIAGDPALAEYLRGSTIGAVDALRRLDNTLSCPRDLSGESHLDGRIWAGLGWDVRQSIGPAKADRLMFAALAMFDEAPRLRDAAQIYEAAAEMLRSQELLTDDDVRAVVDAVDARGLRDCERVVPLDDGEPRTLFSGDGQITGGFGGSVAPVLYRIDVPADATSLAIRVAPTRGDARVRVLVREDARPRFMLGRRPPLSSDHVLAPNDARVVRLDRQSMPTLPRCKTLWFGIETENLSEPTFYEVSAVIERSGEPEECPGVDAGAPADASEPDAGAPVVGVAPAGGGCGCRVAGVSERGPALALLLALGLLAVRRRGAR